MQCIKCGREIPDDAVFCSWCGKKQISTGQKKRKRGNGQGYAYQRGKTWTARWTKKIYLDENNKLVQAFGTKGGFATKRDALQYAANPQSPAEKSPTLRVYCRTYFAGEFNNLSRNRKTALKKSAKRLEPIMDINIDDLTIGQLQEVADSAKTYYPMRDVRTVLSQCFDLAIAEKKTNVNLAKFITLPKLEEAEPEPFTEIEIKKLWDSYPKDHFVGYILTMIYTGMMPGELLALKKDMIDFDKNEIIKGGMKTAKRKATPMVFPDFVAPVLQQLCEESKSRVGNFCAINKDNFYKRYYECLEMAEVRRLTPYACRHTTATALAMQNVAPSIIQEIMRHSKFTTTQRYIHPDMERMVSAVNKLPKNGKKQNA